MAEGNVYIGYQYRLRASTPMPVEGGDFKFHTFGAERNKINIYECTQTLPKSSEFRGQGLEGGLISAQFSRLGDRTGTHFQGRTVEAPEYLDEDAIQQGANIC